MNFKSYLIEQEENLDEIPKGSIPVSLIFGRFQPFHKGHLQIVKDLLTEYPQYKVLIGIVKGSKTSLDKTKNPFPFELQKQLIEESLGNLKSKVSVFPEPLDIGYIPYMVKKLREKNYELKVVSAGMDRAEKYSSDIQKLNDKFNSIDIEFNLAKRYLSGTEVRNVLLANDYEKFKKMVSPNILKFYKRIKEYV